MAVSSTIGRRIGKIIAWLVAIIVILIVALTIFILTFDWNRARPYINDKVTQAIGRPFAINGDLKVGWRHPVGETGWRGWVPWPRFSAANITVGNPDWTKQPQFATLDEIDFQVKVLPLLAHDIVIPTINLVNPSVDLERVLDGRNNWTFKLASSSGPSEWKLDLHDIAFRQGQRCVVRPAEEGRLADGNRHARPADSDRRSDEAAGSGVAQCVGANHR